MAFSSPDRRVIAREFAERSAGVSGEIRGGELGPSGCVRAHRRVRDKFKLGVGWGAAVL